MRQGDIPLTNMLAPGAMSESAEAAKDDRTRKLRIVAWRSGYFRTKASLVPRRTMVKGDISAITPVGYCLTCFCGEP